MKEDARNMDDRPERYESFALMDGEEKVTMEWDLRVPNTAIFTFAREDHTLGNLLTSALLETDHVLFAAYKVPHPLYPTFELRVSTDVGTGPKEALTTACKRVIEDLSSLSKKLTREWELAKLAAVKDGRPDLAAEREAWTERERFMKEQRIKHARWDHERAAEQRKERAEELRRAREAERERNAEIEELRRRNLAARKEFIGKAQVAPRVHGDPEYVSLDGGEPAAATWGVEEAQVAPWAAQGQQVAAWGGESSNPAPPRARTATPPLAAWGTDEAQVADWGAATPASARPAARPATPPLALWGTDGQEVASWGTSVPPPPSAPPPPPPPPPPPATRPLTPPPPVWGASSPQIAPWATVPARPAAYSPPATAMTNRQHGYHGMSRSPPPLPLPAPGAVNAPPPRGPRGWDHRPQQQPPSGPRGWSAAAGPSEAAGASWAPRDQLLQGVQQQQQQQQQEAALKPWGEEEAVVVDWGKGQEEGGN